MTNITIYANENYKSKKNAAMAVYLRCSVKRKILTFNTGVKVTKETWDADKCKVKGKTDDASKDNLIIRNCVSRLNSIFVRYHLQHKELTPDLLLSEYNNPATYVDFLSFMEQEIADRRGTITDSTIKDHTDELNKLKEFRSELTFSEITPLLIDQYEKWLKVTKKNNPNTIKNALKTIKAYLNIAIKREIITKNPFAGKKLKGNESDREFLDDNEVAALWELYHKPERLSETQHKILRYFLFSCFTGLRISDVKKIEMDNIINNILVFQPVKTKNVNAKTIKVPLSKPARQLIKDASPHRIKGNIFQTYSDFITNKWVKEIVKVAGIKRHISFHCARHSFATIFLRRTRNIAALQKLLGHSNIRETMIYAHVLFDDIEQDMKVFDDFAK